MTMTVQEPSSMRWVPLRAGIRNIWEYDEQVFAFAGGRMILRGPNGSGKSNALALLFPFLFDGTMSAAAMDPFAGGRSMKSLLLGVVRDDARPGQFRHDQRLGYVWMEFIRPSEAADATGPPDNGDEPGGSQFLTIGCGARATAGGDARSWFFVTDRRVGIDLDLAPDDTPLTRGKLVEDLGAASVFETAEAYRAAVDRELLGLGVDQLGKLNQLIRALRRPQLAGKLDLDALSAVLSSGLPAIPTGMLDDVADSLDDLERVQRELTDVREALTTVDAFLPPYHRYLTGEARLRTAAVLDAQGSLASEERSLNRQQSEHTRLVTEQAEVDASQERADDARRDSATRRDALKESDRYRSVQQLEQVEELARVARDTAARAAEQSAAARTQADEARERAERAAANAQQSAAEAERLLQHLMDQADRLHAAWSLPADEQTDPDRLAAAVAVMVRERKAAVREVRTAVRQSDIARRAHELAEQARSEAERRADDARAAAETREAERVQAHAHLVTEVDAWTATAPGLDDDSRQDLRSLVDLVGTTDAVRLADRYRQHTTAHRDRLRDERVRVDAELAAIDAGRVDTQRERDAVAAEADPGPTAPAWRDDDRRERTGAPLWACCDFAGHDGLRDGGRAGLEAALDAAGLLDAWISPDDTAVHDVLDSWLTAPTGPAGRPDGSTLADVLEPSVPANSGLDEATVGRVLTSIGLGRLGIAVDIDGHFTLGPLTGRATKAGPEFIGATARAERRARRLRDLDDELARLATEAERAQARRVELITAIEAIDHAGTVAPDSMTLADAVDRLTTARRQVSLYDEQAGEAANAEARAAAAATTAGHALDRIRGAQHLPGTEPDLDRVEGDVDTFSGTGKDAVAVRRQARSTAEQQAEADALADQARRTADDLDHDERNQRQEAAAATQRADTLRATVGADAQAVVRELQDLDGTIRGHDDDVRSLQQRSLKISGELGQSSARIEAAGGLIDQAQRRLDHRAHRVPVLRRRDLLGLLLPSGIDSDDEIEIDGAPTAHAGPSDPQGAPSADVTTEADNDDGTAEAEGLPLEPVAFAQWLADRLGGSPPSREDHDKAKKALDDAQKRLLDDLHRGYAPGIVHHDDIVTVEVTSDDGVFGLSVLSDRLRDQVATMERHLTEGDREVFERHLLNRISHELRRLLGEADEFVLGVNQALEGTRTASGLRVELAWTADTDERATAAAIGLLRRDTDQMGDDDRAALRDFFDQAIRRQRAEDPDAGYRATLEQVLDYRGWHRFQPYLHSPDGGRAKLTKAKFRELSGGEQAVALHLPLFAAAAAHYDRAGGMSPRLVALDEAFAGIDEAMRGELLALTVAFDLDVLLTGHELWGAYAEVPQIAVHDLLRRPPAEGVSVFTLRWDGHALNDAAPEPPTSFTRPVDQGLFATADPADPGGQDANRPIDEL